MSEVEVADSWGPVRRALVLWALFFVPVMLYVGAFNGITCSNDGSHYALLRSFVDDRSPIIDRFIDFTEKNDFSERGGHYYSDRPPGTAVLAAPLYVLGRALQSVTPEVPSKWDAGNRALLWLLLAPALALWLVGLLYFRLERGLGARPLFALLCCGAVLFGSPAFKYGTVLFSHAFSACMVFAAVFFGMRTERYAWRSALLHGAVLGACVAVEYQNAVVVVIVGAWLFLTGRVRRWDSVLVMAAGVLLLIGPLMLYFKLAFGGWLSTSYSARTADPWSQSIGSTFSGPMLHGLLGCSGRSMASEWAGSRASPTSSSASPGSPWPSRRNSVPCCSRSRSSSGWCFSLRTT